MTAAPHKLVVALIVSLLIAEAPICGAGRTYSSNRKTSSGGGYTTRRHPSTSATKPNYNANSGSSDNSHADVAKLSYPNYNSQPNRPASAPTSNNQPIGWNVPSHSNAGPPPAYSASNVAGGAKTNVHEPPPAYQSPNYGAAPPSYNHPAGTNYGAAPQYHNPPTYYNNPSHVPGGAYPGNYGTNHAPGSVPASAYYPQHSLPQDARYLPAGSALPQNAVLLSAPPQQSSSGPGFGTGLLAGGLAGAALGHILTPTQTRVVEQAPAAGGGSSDGGHDRIIIINNGQPINATDANGVTVINSGATPAPAGDTPASLAPLAPVPAGNADMTQNTTNPTETPAIPIPPPVPVADGSPALNNTEHPEQPPAGGIICVPVRFNETDPNDGTKMVEVEKVACYPAPPPQPPQAAEGLDPNKPANNAAATPAEGSAPLAPMQPMTDSASSQQLQQQSTAIGDQNIKSASSTAGSDPKQKCFLITFMCFVLSYLVAYN